MKILHLCDSIGNMNDTILVGILCIIPTALSLFLLVRYRSLQKKIDTICSGVDDTNLINIIREHKKTLEQCQNSTERIDKEFEIIRNDISSFFRKIAIERYQGFSDTGGDQSFSLALLDEHNSGIIITSLQGRDLSKIYAKRIEKGESSHTLTNEEQQVLHQAIQS